MTQFKVLCFDCDGVMFDTADTNRAYYNQILAHFSKPIMDETQFQFVHMHSVEESIAFLFPDMENLTPVHDFRKQNDYTPLIRYMRIEPYLKSLLNSVRPNLKTAVATNRTTTMELVLESHGLKDLFDFIVTALDVARPKPHPDMLTVITAYFQVDPDQILYIGDSELDAKAAKTAEIPFAAYKNDRLTADFYIDSLSDVEKILEI